MELELTTLQFIERIANWSGGRGPLYRRLAEKIKLAIRQNEILAETRLPPERTLASALAVSRSTIVAAYALLREEGWLESRQGSGSVVRAAMAVPSIAAAAEAPVPLLQQLPIHQPEIIDFTLGVPPNLANLWPLSGQSFGFDLTAELLAEPGYSPAGLTALRQEIARYYEAKGLPTGEDQILVTNGAQQALALLVNLYLQPHDQILTENPTYFGALELFRQAEAKLTGLTLDRPEGLRVERVKAALETGRPKFFYLVATFQNPTGAVLNHASRAELVRLARQHELVTIEDTTLAELELDRSGPPPLAAFDDPSDSLVITTGSMSKLFWPGLRIGWVRADPRIIHRLTRLKTITDLGSGLLNQAVAAQWLARIGEVKEWRRQQLLPRRQYMADLLQTYLPEWEWNLPAGGLFLWVKLPWGTSGQFAQLAYRQGIALVTGNTMSVDGSHHNFLRLPFVHAPAEMEEGIKRLALAWHNYRPADHSPGTNLSFVV